MKITELCIKYALGKIIEEPKLVTGGLMHKMYHVSTDQGEYGKDYDVVNNPDKFQLYIDGKEVEE